MANRNDLIGSNLYSATVMGGFSYGYIRVESDATLDTNSPPLVLADGPITVTLPEPNEWTDGQMRYVHSQANGGEVTVEMNSGAGVNNLTLGVGETALVHCDGSRWRQIG